MLKGKAIGFIGGGNMAEAIFKGLLDSGDVTPDQIRVTDISKARLDALASTYGIIVNQNDAKYNAGAVQIVQTCDIIFLSVKPQFLRSILEDVRSHFDRDRLVISIVGGAALDLLETYIEAPVVRAMPNTPMMVREGVVGLAFGANCTEENQALAKAVFSEVSLTYTLPENQLDSLTGVSGCGPAYAYLFIEAMADGGVEAGLTRELAVSLAAQTLAGAAKMVLAGGSPAELKDDVCSPGGATIAGVHALERGCFRGTVMDAVRAGMLRMAEVGKNI